MLFHAADVTSMGKSVMRYQREFKCLNLDSTKRFCSCQARHRSGFYLGTASAGLSDFSTEYKVFAPWQRPDWRHKAFAKERDSLLRTTALPMIHAPEEIEDVLQDFAFR